MDENGISLQLEFPWLLWRLSILADYVDILLFELVFGLFSSLMLGTQEALLVLGNFLDLY